MGYLANQAALPCIYSLYWLVNARRRGSLVPAEMVANNPEVRSSLELQTVVVRTVGVRRVLRPIDKIVRIAAV